MDYTDSQVSPIRSFPALTIASGLAPAEPAAPTPVDEEDEEEGESGEEEELDSDEEYALEEVVEIHDLNVIELDSMDDPPKQNPPEEVGLTDPEPTPKLSQASPHAPQEPLLEDEKGPLCPGQHRALQEPQRAPEPELEESQKESKKEPDQSEPVDPQVLVDIEEIVESDSEKDPKNESRGAFKVGT